MLSSHWLQIDSICTPYNTDAVLELNASDDRGIDVVRNKIKMFAQKKVTLPPGRHKIILLDEVRRRRRRRLNTTDSPRVLKARGFNYLKVHTFQANGFKWTLRDD